MNDPLMTELSGSPEMTPMPDRAPAGKRLVEGVKLLKKIKEQGTLLEGKDVEDADRIKIRDFRVKNLKEYENKYDDIDHLVQKFQNHDEGFLQGYNEEAIDLPQLGKMAGQATSDIFLASDTLASNVVGGALDADVEGAKRRQSEAADKAGEVPYLGVGLDPFVRYGPQVMGAAVEYGTTGKLANQFRKHLIKTYPRFAKTLLGRGTPYLAEGGLDTLLDVSKTYIKGGDVGETASTSALLSSILGVGGFLTELGIDKVIIPKVMGLQPDEMASLRRMHKRSADKLEEIEGVPMRFAGAPKVDALKSKNVTSDIGDTTYRAMHKRMAKYRELLGADLDKVSGSKALEMVNPVKVGEGTANPRDYIIGEINRVRKTVGDKHYDTADSIKKSVGKVDEAVQDAVPYLMAVEHGGEQLKSLYWKIKDAKELPHNMSMGPEFQQHLKDKVLPDVLSNIEKLRDSHAKMKQGLYTNMGGTQGLIMKGLDKIEDNMRTYGDLDLEELNAIRGQINTVARDVAQKSGKLVGGEHMIYDIKSKISSMYYGQRAGSDELAAQWMRYGRAKTVTDAIEASPDKYAALKRMWSAEKLGGVNPRNIMQEFSVPDIFWKHKNQASLMAKKGYKSSNLANSFDKLHNSMNPHKYFREGDALDLFVLKESAEQITKNIDNASNLTMSAVLRPGVLAAAASTLGGGHMEPSERFGFGVIAFLGLAGGEMALRTALRSPTLAKAVTDPEVVGIFNKIAEGVIKPAKGKSMLRKAVKGAIRTIGRGAGKVPQRDFGAVEALLPEEEEF